MGALLHYPFIPSPKLHHLHLAIHHPLSPPSRHPSSPCPTLPRLLPTLATSLFPRHVSYPNRPGSRYHHPVKHLAFVPILWQTSGYCLALLSSVSSRAVFTPPFPGLVPTPRRTHLQPSALPSHRTKPVSSIHFSTASSEIFGLFSCLLLRHLRSTFSHGAGAACSCDVLSGFLLFPSD